MKPWHYAGTDPQSLVVEDVMLKALCSLSSPLTLFLVLIHQLTHYG